jgi:CheY-like chemotaxis protein
LGRSPWPALVVVASQVIVQHMIATSLEARGYVVTSVPTAGAALDRLQHHDAEAILLDIGMELDDAWAFTCAYRHLGGTAPIIAFSAFRGTADRAAALEVDAVLGPALTEPRAVDALVMLIRHHRQPGAVPSSHLARSPAPASHADFHPFAHVRPFGLARFGARLLHRVAGRAHRDRGMFTGTIA